MIIKTIIFKGLIMMIDNNVSRAWYLLYFTYGLLPIIAGLDKYFHFIVNWNMYLNPAIPELFHMSAITFMYIVGFIEIFAGLVVLARPVFGGYLVAAWLMVIVINLLSMGMYFDIAIRDTAMAIGAYVLVLLTQELRRFNGAVN